MNPSTWPDPVRRAVRTFAQSFCGTLLTLLAAQGVPALVATGKVPDLSLLLALVEAAALAGVIALVALVQNLAEDSSTVPLKPLLKRPSIKQQAQGR